MAATNPFSPPQGSDSSPPQNADSDSVRHSVDRSALDDSDIFSVGPIRAVPPTRPVWADDSVIEPAPDSRPGVDEGGDRDDACPPSPQAPSVIDITARYRGH